MPSAQLQSSRLDTLRGFVAEQVQPLTVLHAELARRWTPHFDVSQARERIAANRVAYEPARVIASVGSLLVPYTRAVAALERAGLATAAEAMQARDRRAHTPQLLAGWLSGEPAPRERVRGVCRRAVVLVASSVLRRASAELLPGEVLDGWEGRVCPCCGGPAEFRVSCARGRTLICSRCDVAWGTATSGCLGCGSTQPPTVTFIDSPALGYRLAVCHPCGRYLKEPTEPGVIEPMVERALTSQLDAAAEARGLRF